MSSAFNQVHLLYLLMYNIILGGIELRLSIYLVKDLKLFFAFKQVHLPYFLMYKLGGIELRPSIY